MANIKSAKKMVDKLGADGLNVVQNNGEAAGQTVMHYHLHLIPRYEGDGQNFLFTQGESNPEEAAKIVEMFK